MPKISAIFLSVAILCGVCNFAIADEVYRWYDKEGIVHYSPIKPYGVKSEKINTSFSKIQRQMIEDSNREKANKFYEENKEKIIAQKNKERAAAVQSILVCLDIVKDKQKYQKRRILDEAAKEKIECEYKFNKVKQKAKYDSCVLRIENEKISALSKLSENNKNCYDSTYSEDIIEEARQKHLEKEKDNTPDKGTDIMNQFLK